MELTLGMAGNNSTAVRGNTDQPLAQIRVEFSQIHLKVETVIHTMQCWRNEPGKEILTSQSMKMSFIEKPISVLRIYTQSKSTIDTIDVVQL